MASNGEQVSRRRFMGRAIGIISGIIGVGIAAPLVGYFLSPAWRKATIEFTPVASIGDIPVGQPTFVTYEERVSDGWFITTLSKGAWVLNKDNQNFVVYDPRCTHLNCPYYWDKPNNRFQCPCHDGRFDIDGNVIGGPPPRPLDRLPYRVQENTLLVGGVTST